MTVTTGVPTLVPGRTGAFLPFVVGAVLIVVMAVLPLLNISIPGILPGATYTPGSLALLSLCMVFAALALSYNLLLAPPACCPSATPCTSVSARTDSGSR